MSRHAIHNRICVQSALLAVAMLVLAALAAPATAQITKIVINSTLSQSPTFADRSFGSVGQYEKLVGTVYGELDPYDPRNSIITDIDLAPRNARGLVEYSANFFILKPIDMSKSNHRLIYEINNRGSKLILSYLNQFGTTAAINVENNPGPYAADAGNGWLMNQGYTIAWSGWDGILSTANYNMVLSPPVAINTDGTAIVGPVLEEFEIDNTTTIIPSPTTATQSGGSLAYPAADITDMTTPFLTVRKLYSDTPVLVTNWQYVNSTTIELTPSGKTPFTQGRLYEFTYNATSPVVEGIGFAAVRDFVSFLARASADHGNPLAGDIHYVYSFGISQSARYMRDFVKFGFNEDLGGRRVFEGVDNYVAGGSSGVALNYRFAQPGMTEFQHTDRWYPEGFFPFAWEITHDPITGKTDGRLRSCRKTDTCPKIIESYTETEYWRKTASLGTTDPTGTYDLEDPPEVRFYQFSSLPHGAASGLGICAQPRNPIVAGAGLRALLVALDGWVTEGKEPPESRVPRLKNGTLVPSMPQSGVGFPSIPASSYLGSATPSAGVLYNGVTTIADLWNFGPLFDEGICTVVPPQLVGTTTPTQTSGPYIYPSYVPKDDSDGIDIAGIHLPDVAAPIATYTGWGTQGPAFAYPDGCDSSGQMLAFAPTLEDRKASGDPRPSIQERYPTHQAYVDAVTRAAYQLKHQRLLLDEDVQQYISAAEASTIGN